MQDDILVLDEKETQGAAADEAVIDDAVPQDVLAPLSEEDEREAEFARRVEKLVDGRLRITLEYPVVFRLRAATGQERDDRLTHLTMRRPNTGDLRGMGAAESEEEKGLILLQRLTGLEQRVFDRIDLADTHFCSEVMDRFFQGGHQTGRK